MQHVAIVLLILGCPKPAPPPPIGDGPAFVDDSERVLELDEVVDFDGDGVDEIVQIELIRGEFTASRHVAIYRVHDDAREVIGSWRLMDSNGTEGTGCNRDFSYSEPGDDGLRVVTIGGGEYAGMTPDEDGASHGCDPEPHDYVLRDGRFAE